MQITPLALNMSQSTVYAIIPKRKGGDTAANLPRQGCYWAKASINQETNEQAQGIFGETAYRIWYKNSY